MMMLFLRKALLRHGPREVCINVTDVYVSVIDMRTQTCLPSADPEWQQSKTAWIHEPSKRDQAGCRSYS